MYEYIFLKNNLTTERILLEFFEMLVLICLTPKSILRQHTNNTKYKSPSLNCEEFSWCMPQMTIDPLWKTLVRFNYH